MKLFKGLQIMMFAVATLLLVSCNENDVVEPGATAPNAPTGLMAQSQDAAVKLKWTAPVTGATPTGFRVMYKELPTGATLTLNVSGGTATSTTVSGLVNGKIYEFMVHAVNDTAVSVASTPVQWAPAPRKTANLRLYSSTNATLGSGLSIWRTGGAEPAVQTISTGGQWDICFDDKTAPADPRIASPGQTAYAPANANDDPEFPNGDIARITYWGAQYTDITSLDDIYETAALTVPDGSEKFYQINSIPGTKNWGSVIASKNSDGTFNFGKVIMVRSGGTFVQGTGANAYIDVQVSYQTVKNVPHALKARLDAAFNQTRAPKTNN